MYLYRIDNRGCHIEIGVYDPERWEVKGGMAFGLTADVYAAPQYDETVRVTVSQGAIGSQPVEIARQRADVFSQAIQMATFISDQLADGMTLEQISEFLQENLKPGEPHEKGFRYGVQPGGYEDVSPLD